MGPPALRGRLTAAADVFTRPRRIPQAHCAEEIAPITCANAKEQKIKKEQKKKRHSIFSRGSPWGYRRGRPLCASKTLVARACSSRGVIDAPRRGYVTFEMPLLRAYLSEEL